VRWRAEQTQDALAVRWAPFSTLWVQIVRQVPRTGESINPAIAKSMELEMRRLIVAALCVGSCTVLTSFEARALGWYRSHGDYLVASPGCYRFRSPGWDYDAAYYRTYHRYRIHSPKCCCG
jgi:hypothetical protein